MKFFAVVSAVTMVWFVLALLMAGGHGVPTGRRAHRRSRASASRAWMWEQHDRVVQLRQDTPMPADHPLSQIATAPAGRSAPRG